LYVMLVGLSVFIFNLKFCTELQPITDTRVLLCSLALALFPTIISIETINVAIRLIGSTTTAILGALEPLTAIFFGLLLFHEILTDRDYPCTHGGNTDYIERYGEIAFIKYWC